MYFVDRDQIERTLLYVDGLLQELFDHSYDSFLEKLSLERMIHMTIEAMLDVGNMMIDGFIMRDPGSFHDIIDILVDERVLPEEESDRYKEIVDLRIPLVKEYLSIDHNQLFDVMNKNRDVLGQFSTRIRTYLDQELGVANAFSK
ncbi:DUF86 domain-containing protein [Radiobacillus kanasensis]|uniref:DUF86 domain-containing protein n=1 Tax=Radiobacillus kanasensis TaxID=2844358 RepID=UPI001E5D2785|nr:DUF86 domain-containing protein [Radiobacillus kanasensis]UFT98229.1 DUF86 domain-containing protein [Radiobacillus kanasensis]